MNRVFYNASVSTWNSAGHGLHQVGWSTYYLLRYLSNLGSYLDDVVISIDLNLRASEY